MFVLIVQLREILKTHISAAVWVLICSSVNVCIDWSLWQGPRVRMAPLGGRMRRQIPHNKQALFIGPIDRIFAAIFFKTLKCLLLSTQDVIDAFFRYMLHYNDMISSAHFLVFVLFSLLNSVNLKPPRGYKLLLNFQSRLNCTKCLYRSSMI